MRLEQGQLFPTIKAKTAGRVDLTLPDDVRGSYATVVFYRGHW